MEHWWIFILIGLGCGIFGSTFGVGGGVIMVPVLALAFGYAQKSAQGMALGAMVLMALIGAIRYWMNPKIEIDGYVIIFLSIGAAFGALAGSAIAAQVSGLTLRRLFACILIFTGMKMMLTTPKSADKSADSARDQDRQIIQKHTEPAADK